MAFSVFWISIFLLLLFGGFVVLLWAIDLFDLDTRTSDAQIYAAVLGLIGGLIATSLTFVGVLLKHSIDLRTVGQAKETEDRLRLETAISAVQLLTEGGKPSVPSRQAGAVFVLASLNQLDFALALLGEIWHRREISPGAAAWVVNRALVHGNEEIQIAAASHLKNNAEHLAESDMCWEFPACLDLKWTNDLPQLARMQALGALIQALAAKLPNRWTGGCINAFVVQFDVIRRVDETDYIKNGAGLCLARLLNSPYFSSGDVLFVPTGNISVDHLRQELDDFIATMDESQIDVDQRALIDGLEIELPDES